MKRKNIFYIGVALLLSGCASDADLINNTLSGEGKTPLDVAVTLNSGTARTRAYDNTFVQGDEIKVYLQHIKETSGTYTSVTVPDGRAPKLVTLTKGSASMTGSEPTLETTDWTTLYWDDFSNSSSAETDLRTENHYLRSYYAYCYNGGTATSFTETSGELNWKIGDQTTADAVKKADLLWSKTQDPVKYVHSTARDAGDHGTLVIPFTHAMSEITVTLKAGNGFKAENNPLSSAELTLNGMYNETTFTAPAGKYSTTTTSTTTVKMFGDAVSTDKLSRKFVAIIAPGTKLKQGEKLLDITSVDGNDYTLTITSAMVSGEDTWAKGHTDGQKGGDGSSGNLYYVVAQPGINYNIEVTVNKTEVIARTTLADWTTVNATGTGEIVYPKDDKNLVVNDSEAGYGETPVTVEVIDENKFANGSQFSLFSLKYVTSQTENATDRTNALYTYTTTSTFVDSETSGGDKWTNNPEFYWPNKTDSYFFRALAKFIKYENERNTINAVEATADDKGATITQGGADILWGTTAAHKGINADYNRGVKIPPRTGGVPIAFFHAMSKITINLETTDDAEVTVNNAKVDLTNATIAISNLATTGTITLEDGTVTPGSVVVAAITSTAAPITNYLVIPQTIGDDSKVTITLNDGTTYSLKLKECKDDSNQAITQWVRGKRYIYTIHLEKEQITFRALVKDWEETTGSGNATLEWD